MRSLVVLAISLLGQRPSVAGLTRSDGILGALLWLSGGAMLIAAMGLAFQRAGQRRRFRAARGRPIVLQPNGPSAPGPVSLRGLRMKMQLVYERGFGRRPRPVTLYAATGRRGADGRVRLDRLHAFCHVRRGPRTFRVDRIIAAADRNGVVIPDLTAWIMTAIGET